MILAVKNHDSLILFFKWTINISGLSRYFPPPGRRSARIVDSLDVGESAEVSEERVLAAGLLHVLLEDRERPRHHALVLVSMPVKSADVSEV